METPRQQARRQTMADIVRLGREQLATATPAELSLRAIARDLGLVSSAIYRYVKDRDELLTLLIVDAYDELGEEVEAAVAQTADRPGRERLLALGRALRAWALREPSRFALLYGTPVPGYTAPSERTNDPGTRVAVALMGIVEQAWTAGRLTAPDDDLPDDVSEDMERLRQEYGLTLPPLVLARGIGLWSALVGAVAFEVHEHLGADTLTDPAAFFDAHLNTLIDTLGW
ncbi:MAG: TetR/AcrR family transcriptional regulator [Aeromicrobium sp.]|uniref:TetR/AcrR family transcriptional regulator n=1 Tax=Aeromicrobium sp. TaxID=1871063 RepID=UPI0039E2CAD2